MITNLILSLGLSFAVGLNGIKENHNNYVEDNRTNIIYDDVEESITLNVNETTNYIWENFNQKICNFNTYDNLSFQDYVSVYYNDLLLNFDDGYLSEGTQHIYYLQYVINETQNPAIYLIFSSDDFTINNYKFTIQSSSNYLPFEHNLKFIVDSQYYEDIKSAIELDITANTTQTSMGNSIISAITSGLGLIGDLAREFLTGFSTLFWNANNSTLTSFGTFALVMLGVAITMAVISLVLNLIRGNTGA